MVLLVRAIIAELTRSEVQEVRRAMDLVVVALGVIEDKPVLHGLRVLHAHDGGGARGDRARLESLSCAVLASLILIVILLMILIMI